MQNTSGGCFCIVQVIVLCNLDPSRPGQNWVGCFPSKSLLRAQGLYCTSNFLVQCCLRCIWRTLSIQFSYAMFSQLGRHNIAEFILPRKVVCWTWANIAKVNSLCNVGPHRSRQHWILFSCAKLFLGFGSTNLHK